MKSGKTHYYDIKYPYMKYKFEQGGLYGITTAYSVPVWALSEMYEARMGEKPKSFFDCGAATGKLMQQAEELCMKAYGIDIKYYPDLYGPDEPLDNIRVIDGVPRFMPSCVYPIPVPAELANPPQKKNIEIVSILDYEKPIDVDLAHCTGMLVYFDEHTIDVVLAKLHCAKMLTAIHDTTEDIKAAKKMGHDPKKLHQVQNRMIKSRAWWEKRFAKAGFDVDYDGKYGCFCAIPKGRGPR